MKDVSDPQISPDGAWVAYTVSTPDTVKDEDNTDIWMASWDGKQQVQLTRSPAGEHAPRWSPDGRTLAFLSSRDDEREVDQVWLLDRAGGEPERVTDLPGGVSDLAWSPDGRRLALIVSDPDPNAKAPGDTSSRAPAPIVIDRFQFKADETGWLGAQRDHLYLYDVATRTTTPAASSATYDEATPVVVARRPVDRVREPAAAGLRPHRQLRPVRRRGHARRRAAAAHHLRGPRPEPRVGRARPGLEPRREPDRLRAGRAAQADVLRRTEGRGRAGRRRAGAGADRRRSTATCSRPRSRATARRSCSCSRTTGSTTWRGCRPRAGPSSGWWKAAGR